MAVFHNGINGTGKRRITAFVQSLRLHGFMLFRLPQSVPPRQFLPHGGADFFILNFGQFGFADSMQFSRVWAHVRLLRRRFDFFPVKDIL